MRREKGGDRNGETGKGASGTVYLPGMAKRPSMQYMWNWNLVNVFTGWQHSQLVRLQMLGVVGERSKGEEGRKIQQPRHPVSPGAFQRVGLLRRHARKLLVAAAQRRVRARATHAKRPRAVHRQGEETEANERVDLVNGCDVRDPKLPRGDARHERRAWLLRLDVERSTVHPRRGAPGGRDGVARVTRLSVRRGARLRVRLRGRVRLRNRLAVGVVLRLLSHAEQVRSAGKHISDNSDMADGLATAQDGQDVHQPRSQRRRQIARAGTYLHCFYRSGSFRIRK